jgi:peptide/nickel transport system permease protein
VLKYVFRRLISLVPVVLVVVTVTFLLVHLIPGDPASVMAGPEATSEDIDRIARNMGLDQPLVVQYARWLGNAARGDLGTSIFLQRPVLEVIISRMEPTVTIAIVATVVSLLIGVPIGTVAAANRGSFIDRAVMAVAVAGISIPYFWLAMMLVALFAVRLQWFPAVGFESVFSEGPSAIRYLILPGVSLGITQAAFFARLTRTTMVEVLDEDFVRTARSKGLSERRSLYRHAFPNTLLLIITSVGLAFAALLSGAIVTELIFNISGLGRLIVEAIMRRDYPVIQGVVLVVAILTVLVNLVVDLMYGLADPRVRYD